MDKPKVESALMHAAAEFINRESNRRSLITVTRVELDQRGSHATVFISVFPDTQAAAAVDFLGRMREDFRLYVRDHIKMRMVPAIIFQQDPHIAGVGDPIPVE